MNYIIYTDGGSRGNPGPAGAGVVVKDGSGKKLKEARESLGQATNNFAEYAAVILGLQTLRRLVKKNDRKKSEVEIRMDSELVQRQLSGQYEIKEESLFPLFIKIHNMCISHFPNTSFKHVPRSQNQEADRLANLAMDARSQQSLIL